MTKAFEQKIINTVRKAVAESMYDALHDPDGGLVLSSSAKKRLQSYTRPEKRKTISLKNTPTPKSTVAKRLEKAIADAKAGKNLSPAFSSAAEAIAWLEKEK